MLNGLTGEKAATGRASFARHGVATVLVTAATMALGLLTGILVARTIGPDGRGALTAVLTTVQLLGWLFGMGCGKAVTFALSRDHTAGGRLLSTWTLILLPVAALAIGVGYLLLPTLLAAQPMETLALARLYLPMIAMALLSELMLGLILGDQNFRSFNALNFGFPSQAHKVLSDEVAREAPQLLGGSSDMGDVTWVVPTTQYFGACYAIGTEFHTWQLVAQGKTPAAHKGMVHAAKVLAATAIDLIQNPETIARAKERLKDMKKDRPYSCPIPPEVQPPSYPEAH